MREEYDWNRKDASPDSTVEKIKNILEGLGIETNTIAEYSYNNMWYSNRIEVKNIPFIGSNGKGITKEYAEASAYGEFMERLQSGFLLNSLYPNKISNTRKNSISKNKMIEHMSCNSKKQLDITDDLVEFLKFSRVNEFYSLENCQMVSMPEKYFDIICGSNGLAAGNTFMEAFAQGLCEIFERYVVRYIYYEEYGEQQFCSLDEANYKNLKSYSMIKAIQKRGFQVQVIDCTLNNQLPVLGVFIVDATKTKYYFKLASDINIDICLQRCITEIFQGCTFDLNFRLNMNNFDFDNAFDDFWNDVDVDYEYTKAIIDGTGKLPNRFIKQILKNVSNISIFNQKCMTNIDAAHELLQIAHRLSDRIYVSNLTKVGFPTIRIYMPYYSECFYFKDRQLHNVFRLFEDIKLAYKNGNIMKKETFDRLIELANMHPYSYNFKLSKVFGVLVDSTEEQEYIYDINLLISLLACFHKEKSIASMYIQRYIKYARVNQRSALIHKASISAMCNEVREEEFYRYMKILKLNEKEKSLIHKYYLITKKGEIDVYCNECENCKISTSCKYDAIKEITRVIYNSDRYCQKEYVEFVSELCYK